MPVTLRAGCFQRVWFRAARVCLHLLIALALTASAFAQVDLPGSDLSQRIVIDADSAIHWTEGAYEVYVLHGCYINQGLTYARAKEAAVWIERGGPAGEPPHKVIAFLEGDVEINYAQTSAPGAAAGNAKLKDKQFFGRFYSRLPVDMRPSQFQQPPPQPPAVYQHALVAREPAPAATIRPTQFAEPVAPPPPVTVPANGLLRVSVQPRSTVPMLVQATTNPVTNESIITAQQGVNIVVDVPLTALPEEQRGGLLAGAVAGPGGFVSIDVDTDNLMIWTDAPLTNPQGQSIRSQDQQLEIYMEGNVVFRQGQRTIYANRMYYDVRRQVGIVLDAEILTPVPTYEGLLKLRASVLQQTGPNQFLAQDASLTSSRFGIPTYELRSQQMTYSDVEHPRINMFTGLAELNENGTPIVDHQKLATSRNNVVFIEQFPVFYWPFLATDLEQPNFFIEDVRITNDSVFGTRVMTDLNAYQMLGMRNPPRGTKWTVSADYFSKRGPGGGTTFNYERQTLFGVPAAANGFFDIWFINDRGADNLGLLRRDVPADRDFRGRLLSQHRQLLPEDYQLTIELGLISDMNFLEQYFEREWDQLKDQTTDLELKRYINNSDWSVFVSGRLNPFFTETQWLPRLDHFWLGQPLLNDTLTWYEHSSIAYAKFQTASPPPDPSQQAFWGPLAWEVPSEGSRLSTRQELDLPFNVGVVKFAPYVLGEFTHWDQDLSGNDLNRLLGSAGVRASMPMWNVDPTIHSDLLNVNGLAHKVVFETDISYSQSNVNMTDLPLYDQIDDNNIEAYRRFFPFFDFGVPPVNTPQQFDSRFYALRRGLGNWVSSPSTEIADDLFTARLGINQRWQTKRGPIGRQHIVDWMSLNIDGTFFPNPDRDNFGEVFGLLDYDYRWHVGDRTSLVSEGFFDFFGDAPKYVTIGAFLNRPPRGSFYVGFRMIDGPITSNVIATSYSYRMSPKWISTFGTTFDVANGNNIGQNFTITRIGESFLVSVNVNVDTSKDNVGASLMIQPRFLQGRLGGNMAPMTVPIAGAYGLE